MHSGQQQTWLFGLPLPTGPLPHFLMPCPAQRKQKGVGAGVQGPGAPRVCLCKECLCPEWLLGALLGSQNHPLVSHTGLLFKIILALSTPPAHLLEAKEEEYDLGQVLLGGGT